MALAAQVHRRGFPFAVTSVPRLPAEAEIITADPVTRIPLPGGAWVATASGAAGASEGALESLEETPWDTPLGRIHIYQVTKESDVDLYGPDESEALTAVLPRLQQLADGYVLVDGGWERRAFAAPGIMDGIVLVLAAGYSASPDRSAAAARYCVDALTVPSCSDSVGRAWLERANRGAAVLLGERDQILGVLPSNLDDPISALRDVGDRGRVCSILLPHGLHDEFMIPLVRSSFRCSLVVRDATRIGLAPIYFTAWLKQGDGRIEVVHPTRIIAVATNPLNDAGPDSDPVEFRQCVAAAIPEVPVHDVVLESEEGPRRPLWKFWT